MSLKNDFGNLSDHDRDLVNELAQRDALMRQKTAEWNQLYAEADLPAPQRLPARRLIAPSRIGEG